jgi:endonuclease YncB( thermonuclease family)
MIALLLCALASAAPVSVTSVYDGDTFTLGDGTKVRLAAVNTPELRPSEAYGLEARNVAEAFLKGARVELDPDPPTDSYGRMISQAYVNGAGLSEHLTELGLAHVFIIPPVPDFHDIPALLAAQNRAKAANRGIWSTERYRGDLHITSFHANAAGDDRKNINGEYLRLCNITDKALNVDGFWLTDATGGQWMFPAVTIPAGHTVKVHSGKGQHAVDPREQLAIYLGNDRPIWNNRQDRATLYDRFGRVSDVRVHESAKAGY